MASDPYAEFSDEVSSAPAAPAPADDPYAGFSETVSTGPQQPANAIPRNQFEFEVEQMLRKGASPDAVRRFTGTVVDARTGGPIEMPRPEQLDAAANYYRGGGTEPLSWERQVLGPDGTPSTDFGAIARGAGDELSFKFLDEIEAFVETGEFSGEAYDAAWQRRQQRRMADNPDLRTLGQVTGIGTSLVLPAGALGRVAGTGRQMLAGAGLGGTMNMAAGIGAAGPGERFDNADTDFVTGAVSGAGAPLVAAGGRKVLQTFGVNPQSGADDILRGANLDPAELQRRAAEYYAATGQGARISDLLTPDEARRFTGPLSRSTDARGRVLGELEASRTDLPQAMTGRVQQGGPIAGPESIRQATRAQGDVEFAAFRDTPVALDPADVQFMRDQVVPNAPVSRIVGGRVEEGLSDDFNPALAAGDMDLLRRSLRSRARSRPGEGYAETADDLEAIITAQVPEAQTALDNYRRGMTTADGADFGRTALRQGGAVDFPETYAALNAAGQEGAALGARSGLFEQAIESPSQSYRLAARLQQDPGFQERLRMALPANEADELIAFATQQKQGVDSIAALARIPQDKIETLLDSTEEMTDAIVAAGLGAGGAFKAGLLNSILARTNIGRGAADRLADDLLNPDRRERVIRLLEQAGLPRQGVREIVQGAFIAAGVALSTADRVPEGAPDPVETVNIGVPQQ